MNQKAHPTLRFQKGLLHNRVSQCFKIVPKILTSSVHNPIEILKSFLTIQYFQ